MSDVTASDLMRYLERDWPMVEKALYLVGVLLGASPLQKRAAADGWDRVIEAAPMAKAFEHDYLQARNTRIVCEQGIKAISEEGLASGRSAIESLLEMLDTHFPQAGIAALMRREGYG